MARRLVNDFDEAAVVGHPGLIGSARETPARVQLERVLPGNIGVGSGIVIDSYGGVSKQQDIILFEKHICPVFSINNTPEATYYPVEGVMAVGEVKSSLDKEKLEDAFSKIGSVKSLKRVIESEMDDVFGLPATVPYRSYGSQLSACGSEGEQYSADKSLDQVFGFIMAGKSALKPATLLDHVFNCSKDVRPENVPNTIISLKDGHVSWLNSHKKTLCGSAMEADALGYFSGSDRCFPWLIFLLRLYAEAGRTVCTKHYEKYFNGPDDGHKMLFSKKILKQ